MDPKIGGLHPDLFGPGLRGISFISIAEAGFVFSGNVGTGIVLANRPDGSWSPPSAIGISGLGWGFIMGASLKHLVYLIYNDTTMKTMSGNVGVTLGTKVEAALGNWGRSAEATNILSNMGIGTDIGFHYSQGLLSGFSVQEVVCNPRTRASKVFYGKKVSPSEILFKKDAVDIPEGTLISEVYAKLEALCGGNYSRMIEYVEEQRKPENHHLKATGGEVTYYYEKRDDDEDDREEDEVAYEGVEYVVTEKVGI
jgi:lipid-binding SYLF domain-containing protein